MDRDPCTGKISGLREVKIKDAGSTAKNSTSLRYFFYLSGLLSVRAINGPFVNTVFSTNSIGH